MSTPYDLKDEMTSQNFQNFYESRKIHKWKNHYFPYASIKSQIFEKYSILLEDLKRDQSKSKKSSGKDIKILFFGNNEMFDKFIFEVDNLIKTEFSKVSKILN